MRGELCGVSHKTDFERRRRALATVTGYQDRFVLCDTFWIDETHINDTDPPRVTNRCISVVYPDKGRASESPSMSIRTPSRSSSATGSPARRA